MKKVHVVLKLSLKDSMGTTHFEFFMQVGRVPLDMFSVAAENILSRAWRESAQVMSSVLSALYVVHVCHDGVTVWPVFNPG